MVDLIASVLDLLKGTIVIAIVLLIFSLIGSFLINKLKKFGKKSWLINALIASFIIFFVLMILLYLLPYIFSTKNVEIPENQPTMYDYAIFYIIQFLRMIFVSVILALISMPFIVLGSIISDYFNKKQKKQTSFQKWIGHFKALIIIALLLYLLLLFVMPWLVSSLLFFIFFS